MNSHLLPILSKLTCSLQWRQNEPNGVSNHRRLDCLLNHLFTEKTSLLRVTGLCEGNSPVTGGFPAQRASNAENISFDGVIMGKQCLVIGMGNAPVTRSVTRRFDIFFDLRLFNWEAVDLRRHHSYYDVTAIQRRYADRSYSLHSTTTGFILQGCMACYGHVESSYFMRCKAIYWRTTKKRCNKRNIIGCNLHPRLA